MVLVLLSPCLYALELVATCSFVCVVVSVVYRNTYKLTAYDFCNIVVLQ